MSVCDICLESYEFCCCFIECENCGLIIQSCICYNTNRKNENDCIYISDDSDEDVINDDNLKILEDRKIREEQELEYLESLIKDRLKEEEEKEEEEEEEEKKKEEIVVNKYKPVCKYGNLGKCYQIRVKTPKSRLDYTFNCNESLKTLIDFIKYDSEIENDIELKIFNEDIETDNLDVTLENTKIRNRDTIMVCYK